jgi:acetolactate decarboxylase
MLIAGNDGVVFLKDGKVDCHINTENGMNNQYILSVMERDDGSILAASDGDGIYVIKDDEVVGHIGSEEGLKSRHVELKKILENNQQDFCFENIKGSLVCIYFPDYMDGINAPGWHLHFVSEDRTCGGHVFDIDLQKGKATFSRISTVEIKFPATAEFDTYALKEASAKDIKAVEQGK